MSIPHTDFWCCTGSRTWLDQAVVLCPPPLQCLLPTLLHTPVCSPHLAPASLCLPRPWPWRKGWFVERTLWSVVLSPLVWLWSRSGTFSSCRAGVLCPLDSLLCPPSPGTALLLHMSVGFYDSGALGEVEPCIRPFRTSWCHSA